MKRATFYQCKKCGNIVVKVADGGGQLTCCGQAMEIIEPNTTDAATEKHVPVVTIEDDKIVVNVGSVDHPMLEEHFIQWIAIETKQGAQRKKLSPGEAPKATFKLAGGDEFVAAYEYCNLHGLWKSE